MYDFLSWAFIWYKEEKKSLICRVIVIYIYGYMKTIEGNFLSVSESAQAIRWNIVCPAIAPNVPS